LIQGEKCVIYEDVNAKIGLVRKYNPPQGPNGEIKCQFKVFFRNHNQQQIPMHGVHMMFEVKEYGQSQQVVKIQRSSKPLPLRYPQSQPLLVNETIELDCDMSIHLRGNPNIPPQQATAFQGLKSMKYSCVVLNLQYELNNGKKSGLLPIILPLNILNCLQPYKSLANNEFKGIWQKVTSTPANQRPPNVSLVQTAFQLDKTKINNMQRLMQVMAHCFQHVQEVDAQPNLISFAA